MFTNDNERAVVCVLRVFVWCAVCWLACASVWLLFVVVVAVLLFLCCCMWLSGGLSSLRSWLFQRCRRQ